MSRKRRSLLGSPRPPSASADPAPARDERPLDASDLPTETAPTVNRGFDAGLDAYDAPPASMPPAAERRADAPGLTAEIRATEPAYVAVGAGAKLDTSAVGWGPGSLQPAESPLSGRAPPAARQAGGLPPTVPEVVYAPVPTPGRRRGQPFGRTGDPLEDPPPTEEILVGGMMSELSAPIGAPIDIPSAPPGAGVDDRYASGSLPSTAGGRPVSTRPKYLAEETDEHRHDREEKQITADIGAMRKGRAIAPPAEDATGTAMARVATVLAVVSLLTILAGGLAVVLTGDDEAEGPAAPPVETHEGVEVRGTMRGQAPPVAGEPAAALPAEPVAPPAVDGAPVAPVPPVAPAPEPAVAPPRPSPAPAPVAPKPAPAAAPVSSLGAIRITSNRRVLVYVNGSPLGYAPTEYKGKPGTYSISAMVPGQPDTRQTRDARIEAADSKVTLNFNF